MTCLTLRILDVRVAVLRAPGASDDSLPHTCRMQSRQSWAVLGPPGPHGLAAETSSVKGQAHISQRSLKVLRQGPLPLTEGASPPCTRRMDQQMAALDQLQAQLGPPPVLTSGCPRLAAMRAAAAAGAASLPQDALSYLAAQRFGPGLLVSFPQQVRARTPLTLKPFTPTKPKILKPCARRRLPARLAQMPSPTWPRSASARACSSPSPSRCASGGL